MIKVAFFGLEGWEKEYYQNRGIFTKLAIEPVFVDDIITADKLPSPAVKEMEIISVFVDSQVNVAVLEQLPKLKYIQPFSCTPFLSNFLSSIT